MLGHSNATRLYQFFVFDHACLTLSTSHPNSFLIFSYCHLLSFPSNVLTDERLRLQGIVLLFEHVTTFRCLHYFAAGQTKLRKSAS